MGADLASFNAILKEDYLPPIIDMLNNKILLWNRLKRNSEFISGKEAVIPLKIGRNRGMGSRAEGGTLPTAGKQRHANARYGMKYHYGRIKITGPVIAAARDDDGAFGRAMDIEVDGLIKDFSREMNTQFNGDGTGRLATIVTATSSTAWIMDSVINLEVDDEIDCYTHANPGTYRGTAKILTVDPATKGITLDTAIAGGIATDAIYRKGNRDTDSFNVSSGLYDIIDDANPLAGNLGGINRTTTPYWRANVTDAASAPLSMEMIEEMLDKIDINGDGEVSAFYTNHYQARKLGAQLIPDRRFVSEGQVMKLDGGRKVTTYDDLPIFKDRHAPAGKFACVDESTIEFQQMSEIEWMDLDGAILQRVPNEDAYEGTLFLYGNLVGKDMANNGMIENLEEA